MQLELSEQPANTIQGVQLLLLNVENVAPFNILKKQYISQNTPIHVNICCTLLKDSF